MLDYMAWLVIILKKYTSVLGVQHHWWMSIYVHFSADVHVQSLF